MDSFFNIQEKRIDFKYKGAYKKKIDFRYTGSSKRLDFKYKGSLNRNRNVVIFST